MVFDAGWEAWLIPTMLVPSAGAVGISLALS
jgi:hypothetical protein